MKHIVINTLIISIILICIAIVTSDVGWYLLRGAWRQAYGW